MDSPIKQRLIGAAVLAAVAIIFLPMLLKGPDVKSPDAAAVPLTMPAMPGQEFETRQLPLTAPDGGAPQGGVLGLTPADTDATTPATDATTATELTVSSDDVASAEPPAVATTDPADRPDPSPAASNPLPVATVAAGNFVVNIGSFANLESANALAAKLRAAKLPVTGDRVSLASGTALRLRVGPYTDRATAEAARLRADGVTGTSSKVIVLDAPGELAVPTKAAPPATAASPATSAGKPAVSATSETAKPAPLSVGFAVQLSAPSVEADALALRDRARGAGFNSFVQRVETQGGARFRVRVGPVADRSAADAMRDAVNAKLGTKGIVVAHP